jgi:hypothetical protein
MRSLKKLALCCALLASSALPAAYAQSNTFTYAGLAWAFSTTHPGFSTCGTLLVDATGAVGNSDNYVMHGRLSCQGGTYASTGSAYFTSGGFNMTVRLGVTHNLQCANLDPGTLGGSCLIYDNLGNQTGTAFIGLL